MMSRICRIVVVLILASMPLLVHANDCASGTLASILALPNATCTIAGTTFGFNVPLNGIPEYFSGPWAGENTWGPATNITFTPDASDPNNPGFTLSGDFHASNAYYDITLGFFTVTAPTGNNIDSYSVLMGNPVFNPSDPNAQSSCIAWLNAVYSLCDAPLGTGPSYMVGNSIYGSIDLRFWNRSGGSVGFDSAKFNWQESAPSTTAPEPSSLILVGFGFAGLAGLLPRKIRR